MNGYQQPPPYNPYNKGNSGVNPGGKGNWKIGYKKDEKRFVFANIWFEYSNVISIALILYGFRLSGCVNEKSWINEHWCIGQRLQNKR
jgi:hypothetical protein